MLSGAGLSLPPLPGTDGPVIIAPPAPVVVAGLSVMIPKNVPNGMPVTAVIRAVDAAGVPVFSYSGSATLTSSDATATLPATVSIVNGRAVIPVTFRTAGPQTLTAADSGDPTRTATAATTVAAPLVATRLVVMLPAQVRAGVPTNVSVVAVDATGRPVPTFNGSAAVTSSDAAASLPMVEVLFKNGRGTFQVAFATTGKQSVTVASLADSKVVGTGSTNVAAPQTLASFLVMVPPRVLTGVPVNVAIIAMDAEKRPINGYAGAATLTSSDAAATLPATVTFRAGRAIARVTFGTSGSQSLSVRGGVAGDIVGSVTATVVEAPVATRFAVLLPKAVPASVPVRVTLMAVDAQGRPIANFNGTATLTSSDPGAQMPSSVTFVNGRAVARVTFTTLGAQTLTATSESLVGSGTTQVGQVTIPPVG